jgi:hypothetical protein
MKSRYNLKRTFCITCCGLYLCLEIVVLYRELPEAFYQGMRGWIHTTYIEIRQETRLTRESSVEALRAWH